MQSLDKMIIIAVCFALFGPVVVIGAIAIVFSLLGYIITFGIIEGSVLEYLLPEEEPAKIASPQSPSISRPHIDILE